jgi:hypothetical protein
MTKPTGYESSTTHHASSVVHRPWSIVRRLWSVVYRLSSQLTQADGGAHRLVAIPRPAVHALGLTLLGAFPLAAIPLGAALLLLALFALGDKVHFFAKSFRDPLGDDAFVKASNQLLDGLTFTSLDMHSIGLSTHKSRQKPRSPPSTIRFAWGAW